MSEHKPPTDSRVTSELAREATKHQVTLVGELVSFLRQNKKWWLAPIIVLLLIATVIVVVGGSALAPFIYAIF